MTADVDTPSGQAPAAPPEPQGRDSRWQALLAPVLAVVLAFAIGAVLIVATDPDVQSAAGYFFAAPGDLFVAAFDAVTRAYGALLRGALLDPSSLQSGDPTTILRPISETLVNATPVILTGLAVAMAFRAGLFNIGAQGQLILGAIVAGWIGFAWDLPAGLHLLLALIGGILGGALWGGLVGVLKARTGAHEVITTIMLNYIALSLLGFLLGTRGFQAAPYSQARSERVADTAGLPPLLGPDLRANLGFLLALAAAFGLWWLIERSTTGFRLRAVGANQAAARTAGMSIARTYVLAMTTAGALAGLAGAALVTGPSREITGSIDQGAGFDGITVALLGRGKPGGVVLAGLLFGALRAGGRSMQSPSTPIDLVFVIQALTVLFIAAPPLIRAVFRVRAGDGLNAGAKGWNG